MAYATSGTVGASGARARRAAGRRRLVGTAALLFVVGIALPRIVEATVYYVAPGAGCDDSRTAPTAAQPWCTVPGTRTADNSGFLRSAWGAVNGTSKKIACGDTIFLKGGSTYTSATGGAWCLSSMVSGSSGACNQVTVYYQACTAANPVKILVATTADWGTATSGNFVIDASGITPTAARFVTDYHGMIAVEKCDGLTIGGANDTQQLEIKNVNTGGTRRLGLFAVGADSGSNVLKDLTVQYVNSHHNGRGIELCDADNVVVKNSVGHDNDHTGIATGCLSDKKVSHGAFVNVEAYANGVVGGGGEEDGFFSVGAVGLWCINCNSHDNFERGYDTGQTVVTYDLSWTARHLTVSGNGRSCSWFGKSQRHCSNNAAVSCTSDAQCSPGVCLGCLGAGNPLSCCSGADAGICRSCSPGGLDGSGDGTRTAHQRNWIEGVVSYRNGGLGATEYGGGDLEVWNGTFYGDGWDQGNGEASIRFDRNGGVQMVRNTIAMKPSWGRQAWSYGNSDPAHVFDLHTGISDYNLYRPAAADSETFSAFRFAPAFSTSATTYANAAGSSGFTGAHDKIGIAFNPLFKSLAGACGSSPFTLSACDFNLSTGSAAIDGGTFYLLTNGAGANASTVNVKANGATTSDPRNYFIQASSFLGATPDSIQIQNATCTPAGNPKIVSMTATSIALDRPCTWSDGSGVHLPWNGAAPDMGAYEFGVDAPRLLSVEVQ